MIHKVCLYFILPMCIVAFFLALVGVQHIGFGNDYYNFLSSVSRTYSQWAVEIPDIPKIPKLNQGNGNNNSNFLKALAIMLNWIVTFLNAIISILNLLINVVNIVIQLVQFILSVIYQVKDFITRVSTIRYLPSC